jgi:transcriptional regulator with XRE-family HTH domain
MNEQELRQVLSANIKKYRGLHHWSQVQFAEKVDISTNFLSDIETGRGWVSPATLTKLARILEIEVYELFLPEKACPGDIKSVIQRLVRDMSAGVNRAMEDISGQYIR